MAVTTPTGPGVKPGVSAKVANGAVTGALVAALTYGLTYFIPAWRAGIPGPVEDALPAVAGLIAYYAGAWWSTHRATLPEVERALADAAAILAAEREAVQPAKITGQDV
jgi:hypothetical protein